MSWRGRISDTTEQDLINAWVEKKIRDHVFILPRDFENWEKEAKRTIGKIKSNHTKEK